MKTIGLIGGMSWESTVPYYRILNEQVREKLGGLHSAQIILYSVDFYEIEQCQRSGDWARCAEILGAAGAGLARAGADFLVIATNTMHKVAREVEQISGLPVLHIAQATADELLANGIKRTALLGTRYTMEEDFYKRVLIDRGIAVMVPPAEDRAYVNRVIFEELCMGVLRDESRARFLQIIQSLGAQGAQGCVLGCTEIGLLVAQTDTPVPLFDTTHIHAVRAATLALEK